MLDRYPTLIELCNLAEKDEMEWKNLAGDAKYADVRKQLAKWLPRTNVPEVTSARNKKKRV
ncbi:MAG: hypothetical protein A2168_01965 [Planctomycetes bacterium RBG_13_50_24]|nr:MAG: hypothetical protein A2168_01965 [Planctomycetes bacterium RBG_13_50_24]